MNTEEKLDLILEQLYKIKQSQSIIKGRINLLINKVEDLEDDIQYIKIDLKNKF
tara:strand:- start:76 stop:237 length:162 start_codon:yes stop_codon:yes gene_type:complete